MKLFKFIEVLNNPTKRLMDGLPLAPILDFCSENPLLAVREKPVCTGVVNLHKRQAFSLIQKQYPTSSTNWLI